MCGALTPPPSRQQDFQRRFQAAGPASTIPVDSTVCSAAAGSVTPNFYQPTRKARHSPAAPHTSMGEAEAEAAEWQVQSFWSNGSPRIAVNMRSQTVEHRTPSGRAWKTIGPPLEDGSRAVTHFDVDDARTDYTLGEDNHVVSKSDVLTTIPDFDDKGRVRGHAHLIEHFEDGLRHGQTRLLTPDGVNVKDEHWNQGRLQFSESLYPIAIGGSRRFVHVKQFFDDLGRRQDRARKDPPDDPAVSITFISGLEKQVTYTENWLAGMFVQRSAPPGPEE